MILKAFKGIKNQRKRGSGTNTLHPRFNASIFPIKEARHGEEKKPGFTTRARSIEAQETERLDRLGAEDA